jgi:uncharacterized protein YpmB
MRLLKVIVLIFLVYFIRRFYQMYKYMKQVERERLAAEEKAKEASDIKQAKDKGQVVDADFKVMD